MIYHNVTVSNYQSTLKKYCFNCFTMFLQFLQWFTLQSYISKFLCLNTNYNHNFQHNIEKQEKAKNDHTLKIQQSINFHQSYIRRSMFENQHNHLCYISFTAARVPRSSLRYIRRNFMLQFYYFLYNRQMLSEDFAAHLHHLFIVQCLMSFNLLNDIKVYISHCYSYENCSLWRSTFLFFAGSSSLQICNQ